MSVLAVAPDTTLQDGREVSTIHAHQLEPGDVIVGFERINLPVTHVRFFEKSGFVTACIDSIVGYDERTMVWTQVVTILPRVPLLPEEAH